MSRFEAPQGWKRTDAWIHGIDSPQVIYEDKEDPKWLALYFTNDDGGWLSNYIHPMGVPVALNLMNALRKAIIEMGYEEAMSYYEESWKNG